MDSWYTYWISGVLILCVSVYASITPGGYYGYYYTPVAESIDKGEVGYAAQFDVKGKGNVHHSVVMRPLVFLELGLGISRSPVPAAKLILPFYDEFGQGAAVGFSGKRWYFAGTLHWLTIAGIYDMDLHIPVGSIACELDLDYAVFSVENLFYDNRYGAAAMFTLRPLAALDIPPYFEANAGVAWRSPASTDRFSGFAGVQVKAPLLQTDKDPIAYIDINPAFDHSVSFARNVYPLRIALDMDAVLAAPLDFYLVGALSPSLKTENQDRMPKRNILDRYYLLWDSENLPAWAACGMLNTDIYGCEAQISKKFYNTMSLTLGYTKGDQKGINATAQIPLHPPLSGAFSKSLLSAEGGLFLGENLAAQLNFKQGNDKKHFQIGSGYDFERKSVFGELSFQYDFSLSKQISGLALRLAPNARHRENSDLYVFDYDIPIYQEGNNARRLHNFPWQK
jgi:hypothetical protein